MKATCSKNKDHDKFVTVAHVSEDWVVDREGNWISTIGSQETVAHPHPENTWTCYLCGEPAIVEN